MKEKIVKISNYIIIAICSLFSTLSLFMTNGLEIDYSNPMFMTIVYIICFMIYNNFFFKEKKLKGAKLLAIFLSFFKYCQLIIDSNNYIYIVKTFDAQTKLSIMVLIGYYCIYLAIIRWIYIALNKLKGKNNQKQEENKQFKIIEFIFDKKPFIMVFLILLILWLPHIIVQFPGQVEWDSDAEIAKFRGESGEVFSAHFPPVHIWFIGTVITISKNLFQNTNPGFFLLTMTNVIIGGIALANTFITMKKMKCPYCLRIALLVIYGILPIFIGQIIKIVKDNLYGLGMLLFVTSLIEYIIDEENFWKKARTILMFVLSAVLLILTRNNGIHVVVITLAVMIIKVCIEKKMTIKKFLLSLSPILIGIMLVQTVTIIYNVLPGNPREKYPFFFQQTARYIKYYKDEISEEEKEILNNTLNFEKVGELYNPILADPVKDTYRGMPVDYIKVYIYEFFKHPMVYVEATANLVYPIFVPDIIWTNYTYETGSSYGHKLEEEQNQQLLPYRKELISYYKNVSKLPVINMLSSCGTYVCLLLAILVYLFNDKRYKEIFVLTPLLLTILVLILSPVACTRYCYPIIFSVPMLIAMYTRKNETNKGENK
jgi:hypothetical protein